MQKKKKKSLTFGGGVSEGDVSVSFLLDADDEFWRPLVLSNAAQVATAPVQRPMAPVEAGCSETHLEGHHIPMSNICTSHFRQLTARTMYLYWNAKPMHS